MAAKLEEGGEAGELHMLVVCTRDACILSPTYNMPGTILRPVYPCMQDAVLNRESEAEQAAYKASLGVQPGSEFAAAAKKCGGGDC